MKKRLLCMAMSLAMILSMAACGGETTPSSSSASGSTGEELTKVIYIGGTLGDAGIADATYEGYVRALNELPIEGQFVELPSDASAYEATLLDACDTDADLIFTSANNGMIDLVIGRDSEIRNVVRILSRKTKNNPVLVSDAPGELRVFRLEQVLVQWDGL